VEVLYEATKEGKIDPTNDAIMLIGL
jgi:hypothetical protein